MQTFYIPEKDFPTYIQTYKIGDTANITNIDNKLRWIVKLEAQDAIIRPIPSLTRWEHLKAVFA